jgi:hypothetical protein
MAKEAQHGSPGRGRRSRLALKWRGDKALRSTHGHYFASFQGFEEPLKQALRRIAWTP